MADKPPVSTSTNPSSAVNQKDFMDKMKKEYYDRGYEIVYADTDSIIVKQKK